MDGSHNYNPYLDDEPIPKEATRVRFGSIETIHMLVSVLALTLAFSFVFGPGDTILEKLRLDPEILLASFAAVGSGFIFHELAHKLVAQRYGHWAEFRAHFPGLGMSVLVALLTPFLFAAPGAVMIAGRVTNRENGLISLVGPAVNFVIALIAYPFSWVVNLDDGPPFPRIMHVVALVNALLAVFNLLPFGPLDGRKIMHWNKLVHILSLLTAIALYLAIWFRVTF